MEATEKAIFGRSRKEDEDIEIHKRVIATKVDDKVKRVKA